MTRTAAREPVDFIEQGLPRRPTYGTLWRALSTTVAAQNGRLPALDAWLDHQFRSTRSFGSRDRREIRDTFFHVFRVLEPLVLEHEPSRHAAEQLAPCQVASAALALPWEELVSLWDKIRSNDDSLAQLVERASIPSAYRSALEDRARLSEWTNHQSELFVISQLQAAPLWIRCNRARLDAAALREKLSQEGVVVTACDGDALQVAAQKSLYETAAFREGCFEIQDAASQDIGRACLTALESQGPSEQAPQIWDVCAGAGGKSLQIASALGGRGAVYATDIRARALDECQIRAARAGLHNIRTKVWDGLTPPGLPRAVARNGGFDVVLVDAPCSSSGTWRRNPESRYRFAGSDITRFAATQLDLLRRAAPRVKPGGFLVYGTCSWLPAEDEHVIDAFLALTEGSLFRRDSGRLCGLPDRNSDAMYCAVMRRTD